MTTTPSSTTIDNISFCTACKYCMPCPEGINIPAMMNIVYHAKLLQMSDVAEELYQQQVNPDNSPSRCTQCGQCEEKCTQDLKITEQLEYLASEFAKKE